MGLNEDHDGRDAASGFHRGVVAFDERTRAAISLRLAGYSEEQVEKLLARGRDLDEVAEGRRAA